VTDRPGLALVMRFADCVPVLLYDPARQVVGIAHAGWRGTVDGAAASVVQTMREQFGCRPEDIQAGIGPSIGPGEYQGGEEVAAAVRENLPDPESLLARSNGAFQFDLWEANRRILEAYGVTRIELAGISTARRTDEFYSHRAEHGRTGRFGAVICLNAES
jgi:YfiH family protein